MLTIRLSSSYVLIITTPSAGFSERVGARPPATRLNALFFCGRPGGSGSAGAELLLKLIYLCDNINKTNNYTKLRIALTIESLFQRTILSAFSET